MRILLACGAGLSTSILMKKIEKYCADKGEDLTINAVPVNDVEGYQKDYDCVLGEAPGVLSRGGAEKDFDYPC